MDTNSVVDDRLCTIYRCCLPAFSLIVKGLIYIKFDKDQVPKGSYL